MRNLWAGEWHSNNRLDGETRHLILFDNKITPADGRLPFAIFRTRQQCRTFIKERYGYIATRKDLRVEPHGWRMPQAIKVKITPNTPTT